MHHSLVSSNINVQGHLNEILYRVPLDLVKYMCHVSEKGELLKIYF